MNFTQFKGIIFDLDGTLVESSTVWSDIDAEFLGRRNIPVPDDYYKNVSAKNYEQAAIYTNERFGLNENIDDIQREWHEMAIEHYAHHIGLVDGAGEFIKMLSENGVKIALATASSQALYEAVLKNNGIYQYFDSFVTTAEVSRGKGFPDVYELAAEKICCDKNNCAVFEDIIEAIKGSKNGGFYTAGCLNSHYISDWEEIKATADIYFQSYKELM